MSWTSRVWCIGMIVRSTRKQKATTNATLASITQAESRTGVAIVISVSITAVGKVIIATELQLN